jgi:hypothetical protein
MHTKKYQTFDEEEEDRENGKKYSHSKWTGRTSTSKWYQPMECVTTDHAGKAE